MDAIIITSYAIRELHLKGAELLAYSLIDTCTCKGNGSWYGGYRLMSETIGITKAKTMEAVQRLIDKGLVTKFQGVVNGRVCDFLSSNYERIPGYRNDTDRGTERIPRRGTETEPESNIDNKYKNNPVCVNSARARFTAPTVEEVRQYCEERCNNIDAEEFVAFYSARGWKFSNGASVKDWKSCVITWEKRERNPRPTYHPQRQSNASACRDAVEGALSILRNNNSYDNDR